MESFETSHQKMFSIILATYNCGRKVENTLQSILSQNKDLFELIVFDGGSTDDTLDYIRKYEDDLTLVSEKDAGIYDAFNKGIGLAAGRYIYFIGAGDCLRPGVLKQVGEILPVDEPTLAYGGFYLMRQKIYESRKYRAADLIYNNICHQSAFYHRRVFDIIGKYDLRYRVFADWIFNLKCFTNRRINKMHLPLTIADFEEGGLSSDLNNDPAFKKDFPILVRKKLGTSAYLKCKAFMINPKAYSFLHSAGYKFLGHLISFATPPVRGVRYLRKAVRKKN